MEQINRNNEKIGEYADVLSEGIQGLKELAEAMGEELDLQAEMLEDTSANMTKAEDELGKVNKDLKETLNDKATCCQNQCELTRLSCRCVYEFSGLSMLR